MLSEVAGASQLELFDRLLAKPMRIATITWLRDGDAYGGAGTCSRRRLREVRAADGEQRPLEREADRQPDGCAAPRPTPHLNASQQYGFLWNSVAYDYNGRKIRAFLRRQWRQVSREFPT